MKQGSLFTLFISRIVLILIIYFSAMCQAHAETPPWTEGAYAYYGEKVPLQKLLNDFATNFGVTLQVAQSVKGQVNGRLTAESPSAFLDKIASTYGLVWFYAKGILYINKTVDNINRTITTVGLDPIALRHALTSLGVLEEKFGWGDLGDRNLIIVSGPPSYVDILARTIESLPRTPSGQQVAVFRLKYASVDDRIINYRDRAVTIPGIASILRGLTGNGRGSSNAGSGNGSRDTLRKPVVPTDSTQERTNSETGKATSSSVLTDPTRVATLAALSPYIAGRTFESFSSATIESDSRLNAIIIKDTPEMLPVFRDVITALDIPAALIEIRAIIVDINKNRVSELGVDWGLRSGNLSAGFGSPNKPSAGTLSLSYGQNTSPTTIVTDAGAYLVSKLRLLEQSGDARITAEPSILTIDNLSAVLDLSQTFHASLVGERVATLIPVTTGVTLKVTPRVIDDGKHRIQMAVDIEDGTLQDKAGLNFPLIQQSNISTQAIVGENESLLIGGYQIESEEAQNQKVPVLGDIPFIGTFFSTKTRTTQQRERLFLLTPRIVYLPDSLLKSAQTANIKNNDKVEITTKSNSNINSLALSHQNMIDPLTEPKNKLKLRFIERVTEAMPPLNIKRK